MNGAQLDALHRFFKNIEDRAITDLGNTENEFKNNQKLDQQTKQRKGKKKVEDDKVNLQRWRTKIQIESQEKNDPRPHIEGNMGYPPCNEPTRQQALATKLQQ